MGDATSDNHIKDASASTSLPTMSLVGKFDKPQGLTPTQLLKEYHLQQAYEDFCDRSLPETFEQYVSHLPGYNAPSMLPAHVGLRSLVSDNEELQRHRDAEEIRMEKFSLDILQAAFSLDKNVTEKPKQRIRVLPVTAPPPKRSRQQDPLSVSPQSEASTPTLDRSTKRRRR